MSKKTMLLTHLSYDENDGTPYIESPIPISSTKLPKNRLSGVFGRQSGLKAVNFWWGKIASLYKKELSKVEVYLDVNDMQNANQSLDKINDYDILNIPTARLELTDQLNDWVGDESHVKTLHLGDRLFFRRIENNPENINKLFERPELAHIKAIVWPAMDPDNNSAYIKMITIRSKDDISSVRVFNDTDINPNGDIKYEIRTF